MGQGRRRKLALRPLREHSEACVARLLYHFEDVTPRTRPDRSSGNRSLIELTNTSRERLQRTLIEAPRMEPDIGPQPRWRPGPALRPKRRLDPFGVAVSTAGAHLRAPKLTGFHALRLLDRGSVGHQAPSPGCRSPVRGKLPTPPIDALKTASALGVEPNSCAEDATTICREKAGAPPRDNSAPPAVRSYKRRVRGLSSPWRRRPNAKVEASLGISQHA